MGKKSQTMLGFMCVCMHMKGNSEAAAGRQQAAGSKPAPDSGCFVSAGDCHRPGYWQEPKLPMPKAGEEVPAGTSAARGLLLRGVAFWLSPEGSAWGQFCPLTLPTSAGRTEQEMEAD